MKKLKIIMTERDMTNSDLANIMDVDVVTISKWRNHGNITIANLYKLAEKLNVEPKDLLD